MVLVPIAITIWVIVLMLRFTEGFIGKYLPFYFPGMGIITLLLGIYFVGWLSSYYVMRRAISLGDRLIGKIPFVKFIYTSVKDLSKAVFQTNSMFDQVVLVPFHQSQALGFVMADVPEALKEKLGDDYICVFVPWSLNMTSGTNLFVKKSDVTYLDISAKSALQYMLTAGAVMPERQVKTARELYQHKAPTGGERDAKAQEASPVVSKRGSQEQPGAETDAPAKEEKP